MLSQIGRLKKPKENDNKLKEEEEETARVYADFVRSFEINNNDSKTFIRGGIINTNSEEIITTEKSKIYKPTSNLWVPPAKSTENKGLWVPPKSTSIKNESKKEIDSFLEEIKKKQQMQEEKRNLAKISTEVKSEEEKERIRSQLEEIENYTRARNARNGIGEVEATTNLYLGNLSPDVSEEYLCQQFGKFGNITSVKIMYPRTEEEKSRGRNCGFVSFEAREQAEAAKNNLDATEFYGMTVHIGWGKAVPKPTPGAPAPVTSPVTSSMISPNPIPTVSPPQFNNFPVIEVLVPDDKRMKKIIDTLARYVAEDGYSFEQLIIEKEAHNKDFKFLFETNSKENIYYRWRTFAYTQGDTLKVWRTENFQIFANGEFWKPPGEEYFEESNGKSNFSDHPPEGITAASVGQNFRNKLLIRANQIGGQRLLKDDFYIFNNMLENLTKDRTSICEAMTFCLDHSDNSFDIAQMITDHIIDNKISLDTIISAIYLISDILYNSSSVRPSAWSYRSAFELHLPEIFQYFSHVLNKLKSILATQQMKEINMKLIRIWEDRSLFTHTFFKGLEASFLGNSTFEGPPQDEIDQNDIIDEELDGLPYEDECAGFLIKYPPIIRHLVKEWLDMDIQRLKRICSQKGLPSRYDEYKLLINYLANYEIYWILKDDMISQAVSSDSSEVASVSRLPRSISSSINNYSVNASDLLVSSVEGASSEVLGSSSVVSSLDSSKNIVSSNDSREVILGDQSRLPQMSMFDSLPPPFSFSEPVYQPLGSQSMSVYSRSADYSSSNVSRSSILDNSMSESSRNLGHSSDGSPPNASVNVFKPTVILSSSSNETSFTSNSNILGDSSYNLESPPPSNNHTSNNNYNFYSRNLHTINHSSNDDVMILDSDNLSQHKQPSSYPMNTHTQQHSTQIFNNFTVNNNKNNDKIDDNDDIFKIDDDDDIFKIDDNKKQNKNQQTNSQQSYLSQSKLKQVESQVMELQMELEKKGMDVDFIQLKCDELRQNLLMNFQREATMWA